MLEDTMFIVGGDDSRAWYPRERRYLTQAEYAPICGDVRYVATESDIDDALRAAGYPQGSPLPPRDITALAFRRRFTPAEKLAITAAAQSNPALRLWLDDSIAAQQVDLLDPEAVAGMGALVAAGLLSEERKAQILERSWE